MPWVREALTGSDAAAARAGQQLQDPRASRDSLLQSASSRDIMSQLDGVTDRMRAAGAIES
ncbi:hypothetical protein [Leifsonia sp. RAF41]|uniref:hypothetical protein n=1 Tax=Leifsonia sp. RAF41 TaxID=3233056 RepID=UPI003F98781D